MQRVCPNPIPWTQAYEKLVRHSTHRPCDPPFPPRPLILAGWAYSNDIQKTQRWAETVNWARNNGCEEIVREIPDSDFYFVDNPSTYTVGPHGGPLYRAWDSEAKHRPEAENLDHHLETLTSKWSQIVGDQLGRATRPVAFSGKKARRLLVFADLNVVPPWGEWSRLSQLDAERRTFTQFRAAINKAIAPHEIDHVDFTIDADSKSSSQ